jgi:hypothetical protein
MPLCPFALCMAFHAPWVGRYAHRLLRTFRPPFTTSTDLSIPNGTMNGVPKFTKIVSEQVPLGRRLYTLTQALRPRWKKELSVCSLRFIRPIRVFSRLQYAGVTFFRPGRISPFRPVIPSRCLINGSLAFAIGTLPLDLFRRFGLHLLGLCQQASHRRSSRKPTARCSGEELLHQLLAV